MASILSNRNIIQIAGEDAFKFLQNLVTNDVALCTDTNPIYAMMLSPQGRFLFDMFIIKNEESYLLDIFIGTKDILLQKLKLYKINLKVEINDLSNQYRILYSTALPSSLDTLVSSSSGLTRGSIFYKDPRSNKLGYRFLAKDNYEKDEPTYLEDKYEYGIPDGGVDLLYDKAMPQEYGAEELSAISYTKGCYIGQEVISRTKYQGEVRKKIYRIVADINLNEIPHGTEITSAGGKIGIFCSGYKNKGLALIRIEDFEASAGPYLLGSSNITML